MKLDLAKKFFWSYFITIHYFINLIYHCQSVIFSEISTNSYIRYFMKLFYKREKEWIWKSQVHHTTIWYSWQQLCVAFKWGISTFPNKKLMLGNNKEQSYKSRWNSPKFIRIFIVRSEVEILTIDSQISNL